MGLGIGEGGGSLLKSIGVGSICRPAPIVFVGVGSKTGTYAGKVVAKLLSTRKPYGRF